MKQIWFGFKIIALCVCLYFFINNIRQTRALHPDMRQATIKVDEARKNLELAAPEQVKELDAATKRQKEVSEEGSLHDNVAWLLGFPMAFLLANLLRPTLDAFRERIVPKKNSGVGPDLNLGV